MTCVLYSLLEGGEQNQSVVIARMRDHIGKKVFTLYDKTEDENGHEIFKVQEHKITGLTKYNLGDMTFNGQTMKNYFKEKYDIELVHLEIPAFLCKENHLLPPELCHSTLCSELMLDD
jgi:hypothetical protein